MIKMPFPPINSKTRHLTRMLTGLAFNFLLLNAVADDMQPLGSDPSPQDLKAFLDQRVPTITEQIQGSSHGFESDEAREQIDKLIFLLKAAKVKNLLETFPLVGNNGSGLESQILGRTIENNATEADIPDLLACDVKCFGIDGREKLIGASTIIKHPSWCRSAALTASLANGLTKIKEQIASGSDPVTQLGVLEVANINPDTAIQSQLKDTLYLGCMTPNVSPLFYQTAFHVVSKSKNESIHALIPSIVKAMANDVKFNNDSDLLYRRGTWVSEFIDTGTAPISNTDFAYGANICLQAVPDTYWFKQYSLAQIGDKPSFEYIIKTYFTVLAGDTPEMALAKSTHVGVSVIENNIIHGFLPKIIYTGPGDKVQALKDRYQAAEFDNGQWKLPSSLSPPEVSATGSTNLAPTPINVPPSNETNNGPLASPSFLNSAAFPENTPEADVESFVDRVAKEIYGQYPDYLQLPQNHPIPELEQAGKRLVNVPLKSLLHLEGALKDQPLPEAKFVLREIKRKILVEAIKVMISETSVTDLLSAHTAEGYKEMSHHYDWCDSPAASTILASELRNLKNDISNASHNDDLDGFFHVAPLNNSAEVQLSLVDLIQSNIHSPATPAHVLGAELAAAVQSGNPQIHALVPAIVEAIAKLPDANFTADYTHVKIGRSVADAVEKNLPYLEDPNFRANAQTCLKAADVAAITGAFSDRCVPLALVGDPTAFGDCLNKYITYKKNPPNYQNLSGSALYIAHDEAHTALEAEKWLISSIVYRGTGNKIQDIQDHFREAVYQNGRWILTMPGYEPNSAPTPSQQAVTDQSLATTPSTTIRVGNITASNSELPQSKPVTVTVIMAVPIEQLGPNGSSVKVTMAKPGVAYTLLSQESNKLVLTDSEGNTFRITCTATDYSGNNQK